MTTKRKKSQAVLDRLTANMAAHMARHPRDTATLDHASKLGILGAVKERAGEIIIANAEVVGEVQR